MEKANNGLEGKREDRGDQLAIDMLSPSNKLPGNNNYSVPPAQNNCDAIDESVSVQGVTESSKAGTGIPYSLRPQLNRPINSSSESDRSPPDPLTKKSAEGSTQFSKLKLMQECQRQMNPLDHAIFTSEIALNVDLVVKSLFRYMNCTTLKSCRLVCKKWKYFGAKELQRRRNVTIQLSFGYVIDTSEKCIGSLLTVMENAEANSFPCASYHVSTEELSFPRIQNFFRVAEAQNPIKKLSLTLNYENKKLPWKESTLLEDLQHLLFRQVPNLEDLRIYFLLPFDSALGLNPFDSDFFHLENTSHLLPKVTSLNLSGSYIPGNIFEDVMDAAINLQSYKGVYFSPKMLEYFVDGNGRHRIHLLKHLCFYIHGAFVEMMERLVSLHGDDLKLESFFFCKHLRRLNGGPELWSRASSVISQLFLSSASTLRRLGIMLMRFLPGLAIPRLPNLRTILLVGNIAEGDTDNNFFFPLGFSVAKNFPILSTVGFKYGLTLKSLEMLSITEPVTSVTRIEIWTWDSQGIDDGTRARLYAAFPSVVLIEERI